MRDLFQPVMVGSLFSNQNVIVIGRAHLSILELLLFLFTINLFTDFSEIIVTKFFADLTFLSKTEVKYQILLFTLLDGK